MSPAGRFVFPAAWPPVPGLTDRVRKLSSAGRLRTALDLVLGTLRREPGNPDAMANALLLLSTSRRAEEEMAEPATRSQLSSALVAPLATVCGGCGRFWYSAEVLLQSPKQAHMDPDGVQCPACRFTRCADCIGLHGLVVPDVPCPSPGCAGKLGACLTPTGRPGVVVVDPDDIERILVARDGPILPDRNEALGITMEYVPILAEDEPLIMRCRVGPDAAHTRSFPAAEHPADEILPAIVAEFEARALLSPGAATRSTCLRLPGDDEADGWYLAVVTAPPSLPWDAEHDDARRLLRAHLDRLHRACPGEAAPGRETLGAGHLLDFTADLLLQARRETERTGQVALRTRLASRCVIAVTAVPVSDPAVARTFFPGGYDRYVSWLAGAWNLPHPGLALAHWIDCSDARDQRLHLTFFPADQSERAWLATDLLDQRDDS
ncbi:hypothetical protein BJY16_006192 [Actinoplanes octamycinicus]|uniref:Uncharacterized protein n=1 Tax=Actinoplanes octamycinicus TaxID=135948 RepID=A0A7W7H2J1_9ACTN|nr:hypothetical protein [Actinoplanes octamycinicus]MBB4742733.1 hypothetical protein [Actinoplanes octamycinicus]GIE63033.1 hypothetical protein Aoc01nite_84350 [Actinoplanes octamycinicus]